jgi:hypothetical protein
MEWGLRQILGLAAGAALAYAWHSFKEHPSFGATVLVVRIGNTVFTIGAISLIAIAASRTSKATEDGDSRESGFSPNSPGSEAYR